MPMRTSSPLVTDSLAVEDLSSLIPASVREYAVFALTADGRVATWNPGGERITGYAAAEVVGQPYSLLHGESDSGRSAAGLLRAAAHLGGAEERGWQRRADGTAYWAEEVVAPIHAAQGRLAGYSVILRDATAQKQEDDALRRAKLTFEGILAIASDAVVCVGEEQRITFFNHGAERMFGYSAVEVLAQPLELLIPERYRPAHAGHIQQFARSPVAARRMGERGGITGRRKGGESARPSASARRAPWPRRRCWPATTCWGWWPTTWATR